MVKRIFSNLKVLATKYNRLLILGLVCIIILSAILVPTFLKKKQDDPIKESEPIKSTNVLRAGDTGIYSKVIAQVINKNEIKIVALSSGVVNKLLVEEGDDVKDGEKIGSLNETYTGDEIYDKQLALANNQLELAKQGQKEAEKRYSMVNSTDDEREDIAKLQYEDFQQQLRFKEEQLKDVATQIEDMEDIAGDLEDYVNNLEDYRRDIQAQGLPEFDETGALLGNEGATLGQRQALFQSQTGLDQLRRSYDMLVYTTSANNPTSEIAELSRDITLEQIDNEKDLTKIGVEVSKLNVQAAELAVDLRKIQAELRTIKTPISGRIEQLYVTEGDTVSIGTPIALLNGKLDMVLSIKVSSELSTKIDEKGKALIEIDGESFDSNIDFISSMPVDGGFYEIKVSPSSSLQKKLTLGSSILVKLPLTQELKDNDNVLFIPLDSVFKTSTSEYVLVAKNSAESICGQKEESSESNERIVKKCDVVTGEIVGGEQIQILSGLDKDDYIISDRSIIPGQKITLKGDEVKPQEPVVEEKNEATIDDTNEKK